MPRKFAMCKNRIRKSPLRPETLDEDIFSVIMKFLGESKISVYLLQNA